MKFDKSFVNSIAGASILLTFLGFIGKGIGFLREVVYANKFGLSYQFDLFLLGIVLPNLINTATIYISQHYFIPAYNKIKENSLEEGESFFNNSFWQFVLGAIVLSIILFLTSDALFSFYLSGVSTEMKNLTIQIFKILLMTIPVNAGMSIIMAYQQANFNFTKPAISLILLNILVVVIIVLFNNLLEIFVLPVSFAAAYLISLIYLIPNVRRKLNFSYYIRNKIKYHNSLKTIISLIIIEILSLSYALIDRYYVGEIDPGGISALNYAFVIFSLPISLFSLTLVTTIFSKFSNSSKSLSQDFRTAYKMNLFIIVPFIFLLYVWGVFFLKIFYQRGQFTSNDTVLTFEVLKMYSLGLIFVTSYYLMVKAFYSMKRYNTVLVISVVTFFLKIIFNYLLVNTYQQNGLAASTTLIYFALFLFGFIILSFRYRITSYQLLIMGSIYYLINALIAFMVVLLIRNFIIGFGYISNFIEVIVFIFIYILNSYILSDDEYRLLKNVSLKFLNM